MASLTSLAEEILAQARRIDSVLEQNGIPYPSTRHDTLESLPEDTQQLRKELADLSHSFNQIARGARATGTDMAFNWTEQLILRIIWRYKLPSAIPLDGSASYDQISAASGLNRSLVARTIRSAIALGIFDRCGTDQVCHSALSRLMAEDDGFLSLLGLLVADLGPPSSRLIETWDRFGYEAGDPEQSAFSLSNDGRSLFAALAQNQEFAARFDLAMKYSAQDKGFDANHILKAFNWDLLDKPGSCVVDLGGGYGQNCQTLANGTQHLAFIVQDLPHVAEQGRKGLPLDLRDRIRFEGRSFMEDQQTEKPPDAFLISRCLHNWSDHHCSIILRALIPALRTGSRVLIWDAVLHDGPSKSSADRFNLLQDWIMATVTNGKDRSLAEFRHLLKSSDRRFKVESVRRPERCKLSMIEVTWEA